MECSYSVKTVTRSTGKLLRSPVAPGTNVHELCIRSLKENISGRYVSREKTEEVKKRPPQPDERKKPDPRLHFTFVHNNSKIMMNEPKTPSPLPKSNVLDVADKLISEAERGFDSVESKLSSHMLSSKNSSRTSNAPLSARRAMLNFQTRPVKESDITNSTLGSRSKVSYKVPQTSPNKIEINEKYRINNGEKKGAKPKHFHNPGLNTNSDNYNSGKSVSSQEKIPVDYISGITQFSMSQEGKSLKTSQEKDSSTVLFKSNAEVFASKSNLAIKHDVETNTEPISPNGSSRIFKNTPNSSVINMKTTKPEPKEICVSSAQTRFNVQRMPSVNIRPEFTIQAGPKINIVASKPAIPSPKRKNTELFDIVYPQRTYSFSEMETGRNTQYICNRHVFPSGKLIPGHHEEPRKVFQEEISIDEKQELLIGLIKSLVEKIENQTMEKKNCCRLLSSLPLLASVVNKIQLDCVKCVDTLSKNLDRLVQLVKEELRSPKALSEDHCCRLHETVQYQIVELELMQDENCKPRPDSGTIRFFKHQDNPDDVERSQKKTVSFECLLSETARPASSKSARGSKFEVSKSNFSQKISEKRVVNQRKSVLKTQSLNNAASSDSMPFGKKKITNKQGLQIGNKPAMGKTISTTSGKIIDPKTFTKTNPQVIEKLFENLPRKGMLSKSNNSSKEPAKARCTTINNKDLTSELINIVSSKDTSSEFDQWVQERSFKIQKIHEELSKLIEKQVETYEVNDPSVGSGFLQSTEKEDHFARYEENPRKVSKPFGFDRGEEVADGHHQFDPLSREAELSAQEVGQDYPEDFEDDVEELSIEGSFASDTGEDGANSNNSKQGNFAEIENGSSSELENETLFSQTEDSCLPAVEESSRVSETKDKKNSPKKGNLNKYVTVTSDQTDSSRNVVLKVDTATSPISTFLLANEHSAKENFPIRNLNFNKKSVSTSPIKIENQAKPITISKDVQTETLALPVVVDNSKSNTNDSMQLSVPSLKLVPSSIENIFKVSLCSSGENSLALETQGSHQPMKFIVHLPTLHASSTEHVQNMVELKEKTITENRGNTKKASANQLEHCLTQKDNSTSSFKSIPTESTSKENNSGIATSNEYFQTTFDKHTLKDIIEPTVSEVLKKIQRSSSNPSSCSLPTVFETSQNNRRELVKPSIILQSKQDQVKKCEITPAFTIVNLETPKQTVDSSNQTEAERLSIHVQVTESLTGSVSENALCARKDVVGSSETGRSYLELMSLPQPPTAEFLRNTESSSQSSSSTHSFPSSSSSSERSDSLKCFEKLSEGEVQDSCCCVVGEVCEICVPRLDLSFSELKTKPKEKRRENLVISSENFKSDLTLSNLPRGLEPKPPTSKDFCFNTLNLENKPCTEDNVKENKPGGNFAFNKQSKIVSQHFSELANLVLNNLRIESLKTTLKDAKLQLPSASRPSSATRKPARANRTEYFSSSDSAVSSKSSLRMNSSKSTSKTKSKKSPLIIKSPVEKPKIDAVIEGSEDIDGEEEVSLSSYQTSVTSVSVENLALGLTSPSPSSSDTHLPSAN